MDEKFNRDLKGITLEQVICIDSLITMYYFEFTTDYVFQGEYHDFWELVYVDKGEVSVMAGDRNHRLTPGMVIFHKPNEFHSFHAIEGTAPNIIVLTFVSESKTMKMFEDRIIHLQNEERNLLSDIIKEGRSTFEFPFTYPLIRKVHAPIGSEQLILLQLERLLIKLLRGLTAAQPIRPLISLPKEKENERIILAVERFLHEHISERLTLADVSKAMHITKTRLKREFKEQTGYSVIQYFRKLKIERAKTLIREGAYNFTEISELVGYRNIHYFSKVFKDQTGMNPTEYARSVKARF